MEIKTEFMNMARGVITGVLAKGSILKFGSKKVTVGSRKLKTVIVVQERKGYQARTTGYPISKITKVKMPSL